MTTILAWFGGFWLACSVVAVVGFVVEARRAEKARCRDHHPSSQSVATYLVGEREMPDELRQFVIAEIAEAHAERIDEEWARICEATDG